MKPRAVLEADPHGDHVFWFSLQPVRLRPEEARRRPVQLRAGQSRRDSGLLPALHGPGRYRHPQDLPDGCRRLFQFQRRQSLASRDHRAREDGHRRGDQRPALYPWRRGTASMSARSTTSSRATTRRRPSCPIRRPARSIRAVARLIAGEIEDGACLQIGHRRHAQRGLHLAARPRAHLGIHTGDDDDGIADLYKAGPHQRRPQGAPSRQDRLYLRGSAFAILRHARAQPRHAVLARSITPTCRMSSCRTTRDVDQQHDPGSICGPGRVRIRRPPPYQRHRRAVAVRGAAPMPRGRQSFICLAPPMTSARAGARASCC